MALANLSDIQNDVWFQTNTGSATYSVDDVNKQINKYLGILITEVMSQMDDWEFTGEIATADLSANQYEYPFPSDILKIKRLEVKDSNGNYYTASRTDAAVWANDFETLLDDQPSSRPLYDLLENSLIIIPKPTTDITKGLRLWYEKAAVALTASADTTPFRQEFNYLLSYGATLEWLKKYGTDEIKYKRIYTDYIRGVEKLKNFYAKRNVDNIDRIVSKEEMYNDEY